MPETTELPAAAGSGGKPGGFRAWRRRIVKQTGKRLIRRFADFLGRQSLVGDRPVLDNTPFPFLGGFAAHWQDIRAEVEQILQHREAIPAFHEVSPDQMRIARDKSWRTFLLYGFGTKMQKNCMQAPVTTRLLDQVPNLQTAFFSILGPGYHIPAHRGVSKGILRAHLGLVVPRQAERCRMRVDKEIKVWRPGQIFVFDDTYEHEVWNDTAEERVILLFDFDRPMRFWGRALNSAFVGALKFTAYYQEPKRNMRDFEARFEAASKRYSANLEKLSND